MDGMTDDDMETMTMGTAPYSNQAYSFIFLYIMAGVLTISAIVSWSFKLEAISRLRRTKHQHDQPSKTNCIYSVVSVMREVSYYHLPGPYAKFIPSCGVLLGCGTYIVILLSCLLSDIWTTIPVFWEAIALRSAYLSIAQLGILLALSTKKNMIAYLTCSSHERLIVYHKLVGICVLMTSTLHMGYFLREWLFYQVWKSQWQEMGASMLQWGFAAWGILILTVVTSIRFFRGRFYDTWIILHISSMIGFFAMLILHLDPPYRKWAYAPLVIWSVDRLLRFLSRSYLNVDARCRKLLKAQASLTLLPGGVTKVTMRNFQLSRRAGQYVYLSIYSLGINSHPFTITSPTDSPDLEFVMKAKAGLTRVLHTKAEGQLPPISEGLTCSIEGPYGGTHTNFAAFDSVMLIAGGVGSTFTISVLQDLVRHPGCCRRIQFSWIVKSSSHIEWFKDRLSTCLQLARGFDLDLQIAVFSTCDESYTTVSEDTTKTKRSCKTTCKCRSVKTTGSEIYALDNGSAGEKKVSPTACCCTKAEAPSVAPSFPSEIVKSVGRPNLASHLTTLLEAADGETGVGVCGPRNLVDDVRNLVVRLSDERAVKKGSGAEAIYLHVENQE